MKKPKAKTRAKASTPMSPEHLRLMEAHAGEGISHRLSDYNDFLPDSEDGRAALAAAQLLDQSGDQTHLTQLLAIWVPKDARPFIEDIFERYVLKRKHKRRNPDYEVTEAGWAMLMAVARARRLVANGTNVKRALDQVAETDGVDRNSLDDCYKGRSGWFNDLKKRLARFTPNRRSP